jgi:hypothetical protein
MDAVERARELLEQGRSVDDVVRELRADGFGVIDSLHGLGKAGVPHEEARAAVVDGPVWADQRDRITTNRWVDPPERPDDEAVERLRAACRELPRVVELWLTGDEMTRHDGSSDVTTALALVLDPPLKHGQERDDGDDAAQVELIESLEAAWQPAGRRSWIWASRPVIDGKQEHCLPIYVRDPA